MKSQNDILPYMVSSVIFIHTHRKRTNINLLINIAISNAVTPLQVRMCTLAPYLISLIAACVFLKTISVLSFSLA